MVWWNGDHRTRRRDFTCTWHRWDAALSSGNSRTSQRYQSDSKDCRNRQSALVYLFKLNHRLRQRFLVSGNEFI
ncbi:Uncharacterised protein [Vibrio cholerae]|nr:Uncharacterised protein [Vibrio cholerae]